MDPLDRRRTISAIRDEGLGMGEKADFITVKGSVSYIKHDTDCWVVDNSKLVALGWRPEYDIVWGLRKTVRELEYQE